KYREEKPLALMARSIEKIEQFAAVSENDRRELQSPRRPIVLLPKKKSNTISNQVAPKNSFYGVMLPYTPLHYLLLENEFLALVMTSGNMTDEPIVIENDEAFRRLAKIADYFLVHNRDIYLRCDDSIVRTVENRTMITRRARGFVPQPILLSQKYPQILACGAELKNTVCLTKENQAIVSQHIGDLKTEESFQFFLKTIDHLKKLFDIKPEIIVYDLHPEYLSTKYAQEQALKNKIPVQHHHAHILSCVAEHNLQGPVLGLAFDGTGYGTDEKIWGGEFLLVDGAEFSRLAHLEYLPMPGGDMAIKEPWRMALSGLFQAYGEELFDLPLPLFKKIPSEKQRIVLQMIKNKFNSPETSSLGRLFDLVSSLLNVCQRATYEGQPAIMLEQHAPQEIEKLKIYDWTFRKEGEKYIISSTHLIQNIVQDLLVGENTEVIAGKFHRTLIEMFADMTLLLSREAGVKRIALSGGVFQNIKLLNGMVKKLSEKGLEVYFQEKVPTNDGGISLGQAEYGRRWWERSEEENLRN
ncbi:MAG: carbamoyltransferase HypF, partial [Calditrichaeota bacterium]|nr:carbamoyltransferase HypF [Calditrichota bacterium]